jgi:hypothetical protein
MASEKRLIDANALAEEWLKPEYRTQTRRDFVAMLHYAPTVDTVGVMHGRWEQIGYDKAMDRISCSCCKEYWNIADNDTETFNYCPNCGAKMDGDGNGT